MPAAAFRWGAAGVLVVGMHLAAGWWLVTHSVTAEPPAEARGIPIDLEPVAVPQNAPEPTATAAAGPAPVPQAAATPDTASEPTPGSPAAEPQPEPPPLDSPPPAPEPPQPATMAASAQPAPPPEPTPPPPEPSPEPPPVPPPPRQETKSDAVLATPASPPRPKLPPRPDPRVVAREAAKREAAAEKRRQAAQARRDARAQAQAAQAREGGGAATSPAAPSSTSSGTDVANWRGAVLARLNGFKPAANGQSGTARVAFSVDRGGRVLTASLAGSSGDPQLDEAAVAMVRRASPLPAPPPDLGGRINLTVPVRFH